MFWCRNHLPLNMAATYDIRVLLVVVFLLQCFSPSKTRAAIQVPGLVVNTTYGPVSGKMKLLPNNKTVLYYLGIPYAKADRFESPTNPDSWNVTLNATAYGKVCPQPIIPSYMNLSLDDLNDTCHYVNVFVPVEAKSANNSRAVMLYIHAGGYTIGAGSRRAPGLPGLLATEGNVVVVTFNYRVGVFGFLASKEAKLKGNYGLLDQIQALKWVQDNIKSFGGDPNQVTLFGLSSGGMSTSLLMLSSQAEGLFQRAIMQSGAATGIYAWLKQSEAEDIARDFAHKIGCPKLSKIKDCLKTKTFEEINAAQLKLKERIGLPAIGPVIDDHVLADEPQNLLKEGKFNHNISVISGITKHDGGVLLTEFPGFKTPIPGIQQGVNRSMFLELVRNTTFVRNQTSTLEESVTHEYTDWSNPNDPQINRARLLDLATDYSFRAPLIQYAEYLVKYNVKAYVYQLEFGPKDWYPWLGVYHGADFTYMFGYPLLNSSASPSDTEVQFSRLFMRLWSDFAKTGNPTPGNTSNPWPVYTTQGKRYMALHPNLEVKSNMQPEKMSFWNVLAQRLVKAAGKEECPKPSIPNCDDSNDKVKGLLAAVIVLAVLLFCAVIAIICLVRKGKQGIGSLEYAMSK